MKIFIPEQKCDFENRKFCSSMKMAFDQQYHVMRSIMGELRVSYDIVSQDNNHSIVLYPERIKTDKEKSLEIFENNNGDHMVIGGKQIIASLPNFCEFCGAPLYYNEKIDKVESI